MAVDETAVCASRLATDTLSSLERCRMTPKKVPNGETIRPPSRFDRASFEACHEADGLSSCAFMPVCCPKNGLPLSRM